MQKIRNVKDIGSLIAKMRNEQKLSQEQLAAICGVGIRFIRELEQGKESCHIGKSIMVLQMLGLDIILASRGELIK